MPDTDTDTDTVDDTVTVDVDLPVALMPPWANPGYLNRDKDRRPHVVTFSCVDCAVAWSTHPDNPDDEAATVCWSPTHEARP